MKWFREGLSKDELTQEYKSLAKKYHPDINKDPSSTRCMQEINAEYDQYFVTMHSIETGYNADNIWDIYRRAKETREIILAFFRRDKQKGSGFFAFNRHGKISSDDSESWNGFRGGFAVCQLEQTRESFLFTEVVTDQKVKRLSYPIEFPTCAEMYFGLQYGEFNSASTEITDPSIKKGEKASMDDYYTFNHIHSDTYGDMWISTTHEYEWDDRYSRRRSVKKTYAYLKVIDRIMCCEFNINPDFYRIEEQIHGYDFGYIAFQNCTREEFRGWYDVDYEPQLAPALDCKLLTEDDLYWVDDPVVAHFARNGVVRIYQSKVNFKLRYGTFDRFELETHLHELSEEDAERIQDFLDKINKDFEESSKNMARKGKIHLETKKDPKFPWTYR